MDEEESLEKIWAGQRIDGEVHGEAMWAKPLGDGLYELRNSPFLLYGLNFLDVVRCGTAAGRKPFVLSLARRAGHRTMRIWFTDDCTAEQRAAIMDAFAAAGAFYEGFSPRLLMYDITPETDASALYDLVRREEQLGRVNCEDVSEERVDFLLPDELPADHGEPGTRELRLDE